MGTITKMKLLAARRNSSKNKKKRVMVTCFVVATLAMMLSAVVNVTAMPQVGVSDGVDIDVGMDSTSMWIQRRQSRHERKLSLVNPTKKGRDDDSTSDTTSSTSVSTSDSDSSSSSSITSSDPSSSSTTSSSSSSTTRKNKSGSGGGSSRIGSGNSTSTDAATATTDTTVVINPGEHDDDDDDDFNVKVKGGGDVSNRNDNHTTVESDSDHKKGAKNDPPPFRPMNGPTVFEYADDDKVNTHGYSSYTTPLNPVVDDILQFLDDDYVKSNRTHIFPSEKDEPAMWPVVVVGMFVTATIVLCAVTAIKNHQKRNGYSELPAAVALTV